MPKWVAINPFSPGDYFLYQESTRTASFQVSEALGEEPKDVLVSEGITITDMVFRDQVVVKPRPGIGSAFKHAGFVGSATHVVGVDPDALAKFAATVFKVAKVGVTEAVALAGVATCTVM
jgi:hypothetical protein